MATATGIAPHALGVSVSLPKYKWIVRQVPDVEKKRILNGLSLPPWITSYGVIGERLLSTPLLL
jgi:hypothetical protein